MLSSQFVKGNVPDESSIVGGHLETALPTMSSALATSSLMISEDCSYDMSEIILKMLILFWVNLKDKY